MIEIKTTGLDDYLDGDGGTANIKALVLGRPGSGKTRAASYWKRPLLVDFEDGRSVLADRGIQYVRVRTMAAATEALTYIKREAGKKKTRSFDTVIVDTLDGFQKISARERLAKVRRTRLEAFEGDYDEVNNPIEAFISGLLELDINVVVNVHLKSAGKVKVKDAPAPTQLGEDTILMSQAWELALAGGIREQAAGWFDLVGLMENEWGVEDNKKVIKRHIRWQPTPELPFLKDRLYAFPKKTPVRFNDSDYTQLVDWITKKAEGLKPSTVVVEIGEAPPAADVAGGPVTPDPSGVLPKARAKKAESAPAAAPAAPAPEAEPAHDEAVGTVEEVLGATVVADAPRDFVAELHAVKTKDEARAIWNDAKAAEGLTPGLRAEFLVVVSKLEN